MKVNVNMSTVMARAVRLSARQWRNAPAPPTNANTTASTRCNRSDQSCANCQLKYCAQLTSWAQYSAAVCPRLSAPGGCVGLSKMDGLPYCTRKMTSHSAFQVVGSPSLIGG